MLCLFISVYSYVYSLACMYIYICVCMFVCVYIYICAFVSSFQLSKINDSQRYLKMGFLAKSCFQSLEKNKWYFSNEVKYMA